MTSNRMRSRNKIHSATIDSDPTPTRASSHPRQDGHVYITTTVSRSSRIMTALLPRPPGSKQPAQADPASLQSPHRSIPPDSSSPPRPESTSTGDSLDAVKGAPEPGSVNAIIRTHNRTRLYVKPIYWTADQLRLLGCQFFLSELQPEQRRDTTSLKSASGVAKDKDATSKLQRQEPSREVIRAARQICLIAIPEFKKDAMHDFLVANGFQCQK